MMKYLLFFVLLFFLSSVLMAQEVEKTDKVDILKQNSITHTIDKVSAYPNPFIHKSKITFTSNISQNIYFDVKNVLGKTVYQNFFSAKKGENEILFFRKNLLSGMYLYSIQTDSEVISKRLVVR